MHGLHAGEVRHLLPARRARRHQDARRVSWPARPAAAAALQSGATRRSARARSRTNRPSRSSPRRDRRRCTTGSGRAARALTGADPSPSGDSARASRTVAGPCRSGIDNAPPAIRARDSPRTARTRRRPPAPCAALRRAGAPARLRERPKGSWVRETGCGFRRQPRRTAGRRSTERANAPPRAGPER